ncbi:MAG: NUDIX domain-containing protein [Candidatus Aenigmatarchaeota archaeon]
MRTVREKSVGAVIFRRVKLGSRTATLYLLLHYHQNDDYWEFPRGGGEAGEAEMQTALREIREETGLDEKDLRFVEGFRAAMHYWYVMNGTRRSKDAVYFLAESKSDTVVLSKEHLGFTWAEYDDALKIFKFDNARNVLRQAHEFLAGKGF